MSRDGSKAFQRVGGQVLWLSVRFVVGLLAAVLIADWAPILPLESEGAGPGGAAGEQGGPAATLVCGVTIDAIDDSGRILFHSPGLALDRPGLVATPLHPLERGGVTWARLAVRTRLDPPEGARPVIAVAGIDAPADLAYLRVDGMEACSPAGTGPGPGGEAAAGSGIQVLRDRNGYRPAIVGGRVERPVDLPGGRRLILARLLDARGADPGLLLDAAGHLLGSVAPLPIGCEPSFVVAVVPEIASDGAHHLTDGSPRELMPPRPAPSVLSSLPGMVGHALLLAASGRTADGLRELDAAMAFGGESPVLLLARGVMEYGSGQIPAAIADFTRAAETDPTSHLARYNLGMALGMAGRYVDAAAALRQAADLQPSHARTRFQLALALKACHQPEAAQAELTTLTQLDPTLARELRLILGL